MLMDLMKKDAVEIASHDVDSLIYYSLDHAAFTPSDNTLDEMFQTGNINLISNKQLKTKLYEWSRGFESNNRTDHLFEKWIEEVN
jgi:hypothetical protein